MKKELKFKYKDYNQILNIKNGKDSEYEFLDGFLRYEGNEQYIIDKEEYWIIMKQNCNNLMFIISFINEYNIESKETFRIVKCIRKLNKFNHVFYKQKKSVRKFLNEIYFLIYPFIIFIFLLLLNFYDTNILSYILRYKPSKAITIFFNLLPFIIMIISWNIISQKIKKTEEIYMINQILDFD